MLHGTFAGKQYEHVDWGVCWSILDTNCFKWALMVIDPEDEQKWPTLTRAFKLSKHFPICCDVRADLFWSKCKVTGLKFVLWSFCGDDTCGKQQSHSVSKQQQLRFYFVILDCRKWKCNFWHSLLSPSPSLLFDNKCGSDLLLALQNLCTLLSSEIRIKGQKIPKYSLSLKWKWVQVSWLNC